MRVDTTYISTPNERSRVSTCNHRPEVVLQVLIVATSKRKATWRFAAAATAAARYGEDCVRCRTLKTCDSGCCGGGGGGIVAPILHGDAAPVHLKVAHHDGSWLLLADVYRE
jgi:hypothetical protein